MKPTISNVKIVVDVDESPDPSYLDQEGFEDRRAAYRRGDFAFCGVYVKVETLHQVSKDCGIIHSFRSPGLWGIEDDSGRDYLREIADEEAETLKTELRAYNVSLKGFARMYKDARGRI